ncbi:MAG: hypothetical protein J1E56_06580 [Ruminococcus sp.]|nr:hypothetical protein [Ruminococcus sp.]
MYNFSVITEKIHFDNHSYNSYGIKASKDGEVLLTFSHITFKEKTIIKFAELCNEHQISPVHFEDILENFLSDFETL